MKWSAIALAAITGASLFAAEPNASCPLPGATPPSCTDGALGNAAPQAFDALYPQEVTAIVNAAAAAIDLGPKTIAVVDRTGRPLAIYRQNGAGAGNDDAAV